MHDIEKCAFTLFTKSDQQQYHKKSKILSIVFKSQDQIFNFYYELRQSHSCLLFKYNYFFFRLSASQEEKPLKFDDIVNKTTYDNMRPPKPEGNIC